VNSEPVSFDDWRRALEHPSLEAAIAYVRSLAPLAKADRVFKLKNHFPDLGAPLVRIALETALIREDASSRIPWSAKGYFNQSRFEQATRYEIAQYHATTIGGGSVLEIGGGIGSDSAALARVSEHLTILEPDPCSAALLERNLSLQELSNVTICPCTLAEFSSAHRLAEYDAIWADPARRDDSGARINNPELYAPPLSQITTILSVTRVGIKISPALNIDLPNNDWRIEIVGFEWSCPEQILWRGVERTNHTAFLADVGERWGASEESLASSPCSLGLENVRYLVEPHPALVRSQRVQEFFAENKMYSIDPHSALGGTTTLPAPSPWYRIFQIHEHLKFDLKKLRARLEALRWDSRTQIKTRGVRDNPDLIHRQLKLHNPSNDDSWGYVFVIKLGNTPYSLITKRVDA
jgi:hypothetical protein